MPERIQRKRTKGWQKPEGAVYVGRGSKWGNPWSVIPHNGGWGLSYGGVLIGGMYAFKTEAVKASIWAYSKHIERDKADIRSQLAGKDLMCWCPLDQPCHADVLLEIANGGGDRG